MKRSDNMSDIKRSIYDTNLPTLIVNKWDLGEKYPEIGSGDEGTIYNYNNQYALKTFSLFRSIEYFYGERLTSKFAKLEAMCSLKDESFCFPIGLLGFKDLYKEGCYMDLIQYDKDKKDFNYLKKLEDIQIILKYILKADDAIQRIHSKGVRIGDIKESNILIDLNGNPIFIDTDNYAFQDFSFDLIPDRAYCLEERYGKPSSLKDNDIFLFSMMALKLLTHNNDFRYLQSDEQLTQLINDLNVSIEVKEGLKLIFSDSQNKPYIGPILQKINPKHDLLLMK